MKVPLIFAGPRIRHGSSDALVYLLDLYPTVCDLVGTLKPAGIDGRSFKPVLSGAAKKARRELFLSYLGVQRAIRDDRWKLIRYPQVNVTQLFDLRRDPDETRNLANDPAQARHVKRLLARLAAQQKHFADEQLLTVPNPKPARWTPPAEKQSEATDDSRKELKETQK